MSESLTPSSPSTSFPSSTNLSTPSYLFNIPSSSSSSTPTTSYLWNIPSASNVNAPYKTHSSNLNIGALIGGLIGGLLLVVFGGLLYVECRLRRKIRKTKRASNSMHGYQEDINFDENLRAERSDGTGTTLVASSEHDDTKDSGDGIALQAV